MIPDYIERNASDPQFIAHVIFHMKKHHLGRENAASLETLISELFGMTIQNSQYRTVERTLRRAFEVILNEQKDGLPASDPAIGHWWTKSVDDGLPYIDKQRARIRTMAQNLHRYESNLYETYGGQISLL